MLQSRYSRRLCNLGSKFKGIRYYFPNSFKFFFVILFRWQGGGSSVCAVICSLTAARVITYHGIRPIGERTIGNECLPLGFRIRLEGTFGKNRP